MTYNPNKHEHKHVWRVMNTSITRSSTYDFITIELYCNVDACTGIFTNFRRIHENGNIE